VLTMCFIISFLSEWRDILPLLGSIYGLEIGGQNRIAVQNLLLMFA